ncbi:hypothetical protein CDAR_182891, partial [Caerostris darwini]
SWFWEVRQGQVCWVVRAPPKSWRYDYLARAQQGGASLGLGQS